MRFLLPSSGQRRWSAWPDDYYAHTPGPYQPSYQRGIHPTLADRREQHILQVSDNTLRQHTTAGQRPVCLK